MKTFFNDVLNELEKRYSGTLTLDTIEEKELLKSILLDFESGILGTKFNLAQKRSARKKPTVILEQEETPVDLLQKYYSKQKLHLDSKDAQQLIELGFRKGATYNAPGNAGGAFNETISNEGVILIDKFDLSLKDLALVLYYRTLNTELGKQQKEYPRNGIEIPHEVSRIHQDLYVGSYLAAKSAMAKYNRSIIGTKMLEKTCGFEIASRMAYGGSAGDLKTLSDKIISANVCYIYDADLNKVVEIPRLIMLTWAMAAGSKVNSGDTVVLVSDEAGNILYDGWSDKKALNDIQSNGTLNDDFTKIINRITGFHNLGMLSLEHAKSTIDMTDKYQNDVIEIEAGYKNAAIGEATYFLTLPEKDKEIISIWMDIQESFYKRNKTSNHVENSKKSDGFAGSTNIDYLDYLMNEGVHKSATRCKVINRIAFMDRLWFKRNKKDIPFELNTQGIVSIARESAMSKHTECVNKLNEYTIDYHGSILSLGDVLSFYDVIDMLQILKIETPESDTDYNQFLKRNTNLIMGGIRITPDLIKVSLDISTLKNYIINCKLVSEERTMYDKTNTFVTGKVIRLSSIDPSGNKKCIGDKVYRSKQGFSGKTDNTMKWSSEIQESFRNNV